MSTLSKEINRRSENRPTAKPASSTRLALEALALIPLYMLAEGRNQSIPSLIHDLTGLSKARISKGNIDTIRPSTLKKIDEHQQRWLANYLEDPEALAHAHEKIATAPKTKSGNYASWTGWMHQLEFPPEVPLPMSKAVALTIDELTEALVAACDEDDLAKFKQILLSHIERHGSAVSIAGEAGFEHATEQELKELQALNDWAQTTIFIKKVCDTLYWDMISTLDAEWNSHYFSGRQRRSLFPLVMVRVQDGLLEGRKPLSRKNIIFRPSRRLLEFLYALLFYMRYKKWPDGAPSPQVLASILSKPSAQEVLSNSDVSNYFDGSTKLTLDLVYDHWVQMRQHFTLEKAGQGPGLPFPIVMLALHWQTLLVRDKGKSFLLPDLERYNLFWNHRRQQWESQQSAQHEFLHNASPKKGEPIEWPAWMLSQSSLSS